MTHTPGQPYCFNLPPLDAIKNCVPTPGQKGTLADLYSCLTIPVAMSEYSGQEDDDFIDTESYNEESEDDLNFSDGEGDLDVKASKLPSVTRFQTLTPDMISKKMFDIINDVNAVFQVLPLSLPSTCHNLMFPECSAVTFDNLIIILTFRVLVYTLYTFLLDAHLSCTHPSDSL